MATTSTTGTCNFCDREISKRTMSRHVQTCKARLNATSENERQGHALHIFVEGRYLPQYWMHVEVPGDATLDVLDYFLRDMWLECCDHLSAFDIGGASYDGAGDPLFSPDDSEMQYITLESVLAPKQKFTHDYDFGTTTRLALRVVSDREGLVGDRSEVQLLARNLPPEIPCDECGQPATHVANPFLMGSADWLCDRCVDKHGYEPEDGLLPVVNSPRVGVCSYMG